MSEYLKAISRDDIICALATPPGTGAVALIRLSGKGCLASLGKIFSTTSGKEVLENAKGYTIHHGTISHEGKTIDEVLVSVFREPHSYTGEDIAEIGIHGSPYIQKQVLQLLLDLGARMAGPGEFTLRAFLNGKFDLSQAEAVADLIAAQTGASHQLAMDQMRGGFSRKLTALRQQLLDFAALLELELDFSEEDVEFANREKLFDLLLDLKGEMLSLLDSFSLGNVLKQGVPVAITGKPNVGKSTLLNAILNEERALVSEVPGTTRDYIEDVMILNGTAFRFIDTAGLRKTLDRVENMGIEKSLEKISQARIILYVFDISKTSCEELSEELAGLKEMLTIPEVEIIPLANKTDLLVESPECFKMLVDWGTVFVSAKRKENINLVIDRLQQSQWVQKEGDTVVVSNVRHYEAIQSSLDGLLEVEAGFRQHRSIDLIAIDLKQVLYALGSITGEIVPDEVLGSVFSRFCIGK